MRRQSTVWAPTDLKAPPDVRGDVAKAIAIFDKSADRTRPNAQTAAWAVIRARLATMEANDARWREVSDKAWFVDAVSYAYGLREGTFDPTIDADEATAAIDAALKDQP